MPQTPVPDAVGEFLARPNPAVVATLRRNGAPHSAATWYDWDDGRVLLNMDATRLRLAHMRRDPRISLTVIDEDNWYRQITLMGRVVSIAPDPELRDIDRLARRYTGKDYGHRAPARRDHRRPTSHRLDHHEPERLLPFDREQRRARMLQQLDLLTVRHLAEILDPVDKMRPDQLVEVRELLRILFLAGDLQR